MNLIENFIPRVVYCGIDHGDTGKNNRFVWRCVKGVRCDYYLYYGPNNSQFKHYNDTHGWTKSRLATPQEKEHLEQCIRKGKYIDYKPSLLTLNYLIL